jgi:hypothetical protein
VWGRGLVSAGSEYGPVTGFCEHGNEPSGSIKDGEFLDLLSDHQLLKDCSTALIMFVKSCLRPTVCSKGQ